MAAILHNTVHVLLALLLPPLLLGVINKTKALFAGRVGPPWLQPYHDLVKLFRKGSRNWTIGSPFRKPLAA